MKNIVSKNFLLVFSASLFGIILGIAVTFFLSPKSEVQFVTIPEAPYILKDPITPDRWTYLETEIEERIRFQTTPYIIHPNTTDGRKDVTINIPAFYGQTEEQKDNFFKEVKQAWKYGLAINVTDNRILRMPNIWQIFASLNDAKRLTLSFYGYPVNYYEIFDAIKWNPTPDMEIFVWTFGPSFPHGFVTDPFIVRAKKMVENNNKGISLAIFSFNLWAQGMSWLLSDTEKSLKFFPTKMLSVGGITIRPFPDANDARQGKEKVEAFFKESPIENIDFGLVGAKESGKIRLLGF